MRQQFLADQMERAREDGTDRVCLVHLSPCHNHDFKRITSPALKSLGETATGVWSSLMKDKSKFKPASIEAVFGSFDAHKHPALKLWYDYITQRYAWVLAGSTQPV